MQILVSTKTRQAKLCMPFTSHLFSRICMKIPVFLFVFICSQTNAKPIFGQQINLSKKNTPLLHVLKEIQKQSGYNFFYDEPLLKQSNPVNISLKDATIKQALDMCFDQQPRLTYAIVGKVVIIKLKNVDSSNNRLTKYVLQAAIDPIKIHVVDSTGKPLVGASVSIVGTTIGFYTNESGDAILTQVTGDASMLISYVGYIRQEIQINNRLNITVQLQAYNAPLDEIVVVGYGTQKKSVITGAISTVNAVQMKDQPVSNPMQALQGKTPGVQITQNSGAPGAPIQVRVRGLTSINNSDPLYVIDGVPLASNGLNSLDPANIESIDILKDASAQAIYGSRGANGVVLIKTKSGKKGISNISIDGFQGLQSVAKKIKLLNAADYVRLNSEAYTNAGQQASNPFLKTPADTTTTTDWQNELFTTAPIYNYNLAFSGGTDNLTYRLSTGYMKQKGVVTGSEFDRISLTLNTTFKPRKYIEIGENISINKTQTYSVQTNYYNNVVNDALSEDPTIPVKDASGNYTATKYSDIVNPLARINYLSTNSPYNNWGVIGNLYLQVQPVKGLTLKSMLSVDVTFGDSKSFTPQFNVSPNFNNPTPSLSRSKDQATNLTWDNTATYETAIGAHHFTLLAGVSAEKYTYNWINAANQGQPGNDPYLQYLDAGISGQQVGGSQQEWTLLSNIGRLNYDYKGTYLLTATIRRDGSSKFGENNKYGNFPSASLGWVLTNESFFKSNNLLNYLKVRGSWGIVGNQASVGYYDFSSTIYNSYYAKGLNPIAAPVAAPGGLPNPNLKWEQINQWNAGFDYRLLDNRLTGSFDYYVKTTNDMLLSLPILSESGFTGGPRTNAGSMRNSGFEFATNYTQDIGKDFNFTAGFHFATLRNKVLSLKETGEQIYSSNFKPGSIGLTEVGHSVASFYGYVFDGIFQNQQDVNSHAKQQSGTAPGDIRFKDLNGDGVIDQNDQTFLGSPIPSFTYGFNLGANYKTFDLSMNFDGVAGNKIAQAYKYYTNGLFISNYNMETETLGRWTGEGTSNRIPRLISSDPNNNSRVSSYYLSSGAYLRLRNISLGYSIPKKQLERMGLKQLRLYVSAQNLLTFTKYRGYDPEVGIQYSGSGGTLDMGIDNGNYPLTRTFSLGLNLTF